MRHRKSNRKFSRTTSHRKSMFANLAMALIENGRIRTTDAKAKELRRFAERLVTLGKKGTLDARRQALGVLGAPGKHRRQGADERTRAERSVAVLFEGLATQFKDRHGGYTRIVKIGPRAGDAAPMSLIEFVGYEAGKSAEAEA